MATNNSLNNETQELTIDPGSSGDSFVQFDINTTGEFRIGVDDDVADSFKISQGSALGTNDTFIMTSAGERTMPLQPAFLAFLSSTDTDVTGDGSAFTLGSSTALTEVFDQGSNFTTAGIFTAPVTGKYLFTASIRCDQLAAAHTSAQIRVVTSNRSYFSGYSSSAARDSGNQLSSQISTVADMDASDTASFLIRWANSTKTVDVFGNATALGTYCSGCLIA